MTGTCICFVEIMFSSFTMIISCVGARVVHNILVTITLTSTATVIAAIAATTNIYLLLLLVEILSRSNVVSSTKITLKGESCKDEWLFEETLLDCNHCAAVCTGVTVGDTCQTETTLSQLPSSQERFFRSFRVLSIDQLLCLDSITDEIDSNLWTSFENKSYSAR